MSFPTDKLVEAGTKALSKTKRAALKLQAKTNKLVRNNPKKAFVGAAGASGLAYNALTQETPDPLVEMGLSNARDVMSPAAAANASNIEAVLGLSGSTSGGTSTKGGDTGTKATTSKTSTQSKDKTKQRMQVSTTGKVFNGAAPIALPAIKITAPEVGRRRVYEGEVLAFAKSDIIKALTNPDLDPTTKDELTSLAGSADTSSPAKTGKGYLDASAYKNNARLKGMVYTNNLSSEAANAMGFDIQSREDAKAFNETTPEGQLLAVTEARIKANAKLLDAKVRLRDGIINAKYPGYAQARADYATASASGDAVLARHAAAYIQGVEAIVADNVEAAVAGSQEFLDHSMLVAKEAEAKLQYDAAWETRQTMATDITEQESVVREQETQARKMVKSNIMNNLPEGLRTSLNVSVDGLNVRDAQLAALIAPAIGKSILLFDRHIDPTTNTLDMVGVMTELAGKDRANTVEFLRATNPDNYSLVSASNVHVKDNYSVEAMQALMVNANPSIQNIMAQQDSEQASFVSTVLEEYGKVAKDNARLAYGRDDNGLPLKLATPRYLTTISTARTFLRLGNDGLNKHVKDLAKKLNTKLGGGFKGQNGRAELLALVLRGDGVAGVDMLQYSDQLSNIRFAYRVAYVKLRKSGVNMPMAMRKLGIEISYIPGQ